MDDFGEDAVPKGLFGKGDVGGFVEPQRLASERREAKNGSDRKEQGQPSPALPTPISGAFSVQSVWRTRQWTAGGIQHGRSVTATGGGGRHLSLEDKASRTAT